MKSFTQYITEAESLTFVRFGGLSSVPQAAYDPYTDDPHKPPARRGIYAFVEPFVERFLLGKNEFDPRRMEWVKDHKGNLIDQDHPEFQSKMNHYGSFLRKGKETLYQHKKPKKFKYNGDIWHHLGIYVPRHEIIATKIGWVKTNMSTFKKALNRAMGEEIHQRKQIGFRSSSDFMEVFIEKV